MSPSGSTRNPLSTFILAVAVCVLILALWLCHRKPKVHDTPLVTSDTPIKVGGGAMTFFSESPWSGSGPFCSPVSVAALQAVTVERYFDSKGARVDDTSPVSGLSAWTINFYGHLQNEGSTSQPSSNGISMVASGSACAGQPGVVISPLGNGSFYSGQLVAGGKFQGNKRFADTSCSTDRDRCERVARADFLDGNGKLIQSYFCPDGFCHLSVGN